ncbi:MAG: carbamoyltransferase HypF [Vicinamibacterales bacterium]
MRERLRMVVRGAVQGVGFRPFVHRLATGLALEGFVRNASGGVHIEVEGPADRLETFRLRLPAEVPPRAVLQGIESAWLDAAGHHGFEIRASIREADGTSLVLPDIATCPDCLRELFDPADRRYRYPFTNCTNCGPRFSIIESMPYDRATTTMRAFTLCPDCAREYDDPADRRFHAQPVACPACGPRLALWRADGSELARDDDAIAAVVEALGRGRIVAVQGIGGFQLLVDAANGAAVRRLRRRKHRDEKPFALMAPSIEMVRALCHVNAAEAALLAAPEAPIVILDRIDPLDRGGDAAAASPAWDLAAPAVAPGCPTLGVMLPYSPLHHLLMADWGRPVVATSGNLSDEPLCTDPREALARLWGIADLWLVHDRPIARHVDDSIARIVLGRELVVRRARGYAPLPVSLTGPAPPAFAVGGHLKNTIALAAGASAFLSQHVGDLDTAESIEAFRRVSADLTRLLDVHPATVVADLHPDYQSTHEAEATGLPVARVQHHVAHVAAGMAENAIDPPVIGVSWDGTGYGTDGTVWGGEWIDVDADGWRRFASLRPFRLPGGERAVREPRRAALGLLHAWDSALAREPRTGARLGFVEAEHRNLLRMLDLGLNAPVTTSAGRLFDALAALLGLCLRSGFEGQAAMRLEWACDDAGAGAGDRGGSGEGAGDATMDVTVNAGTPAPDAPALVVDWAPLVSHVLREVDAGVKVSTVARTIHRAMAAAIVEVAGRADRERVVLTGGCFQNRRLTELVVPALRRAGHRPYWHQRVPPNDGGLAVGQLAAWQHGLDGPPRAAARAPSRATREGLSAR